jgi:hypothetical protein
MFAITRRAISYIAHAIVSAAMLCALVPARGRPDQARLHQVTADGFFLLGVISHWPRKLRSAAGHWPRRAEPS